MQAWDKRIWNTIKLQKNIGTYLQVAAHLKQDNLPDLHGQGKYKIKTSKSLTTMVRTTTIRFETIAIR